MEVDRFSSGSESDRDMDFAGYDIVCGTLCTVYVSADSTVLCVFVL